MSRVLRLAPMLVAAVVAAIAIATAAAATNPSRLVLRLADLPTGFAVEADETGPRSNAAAKRASITPAQLEAVGRITGYEATFTKDSTIGIISISSYVNLYRTAHGAHVSFVETAKRYGTRPFTRIPVGAPLGGEAMMGKMTRSSGGMKVDLAVVTWSRGAMGATVLAIGLSGEVDPSDVVMLAQKQNARMKKASQ